jgi:cell wall-associated NlpC family hydrolase
MSLDGIAAIQARIQQIQQQVAMLKTPASAAGVRSGASTNTEFASMLSSAIGTQEATGSATGATDISSLLQSVTGAAANPTLGLGGLGSAGPGAAPNQTATDFVATALGQSGKPYVWASSASSSDANPTSFDCSELTKWAAARNGVTIPDGAAHQYVWLKEQGATMTVEEALRTPGALLFTFDSEPQPGLGGEPPRAHVAISLGNGKTIEARGRAYGTGVFDAGDRFNYAGMIPGMS